MRKSVEMDLTLVKLLVIWIHWEQAVISLAMLSLGTPVQAELLTQLMNVLKTVGMFTNTLRNAMMEMSFHLMVVMSSACLNPALS